MDDSTRSVVLAALGEDLAHLWEGVVEAAEPTLETAEGTVRDGVLAIGAQLLAAALAARGTGKAGPREPCGCGGEAGFEGYRPKGVQTVVGWITVRRAYYSCPTCGQGHCPLDAALGLTRDSLSPGLRRLAGRFGALLPFAEAARSLADAGRVHLSANTVRRVTEAVGARREQELAAAIAAAWAEGLAPAPSAPPPRLYVAMDGVRILGTDGAGHEVKVGVVVPVRGAGRSARRERASYAAGLEPAACFGRRLALEAHRRGLEGAGALAVLGDGAEWIWNVAAEHFPGATQIVDWFHERAGLGAGAGAVGRGHGADGGLGGDAARPVGPGTGRHPGHRMANAALSRRRGSHPRRASDLFHESSPAHGLRSLPCRRLGYRLWYGRKCLQAGDRCA